MRTTDVTGIRWALLEKKPLNGERLPTGTYVADERSGQVVVNLRQRIVTTAPGVTSDCTRTGSRTYPIAQLPKGALSLGTLTVNGYDGLRLDVDASLFDLLIDTTSMVCTITDDAGAHTEPPIAAGPEGGVLKIGERGVVKSGGKIAGGNADAPFVTAIDHGTDTYTYSYSFIESR